jgi:TonB family C-terminal domain
MFRVLNRWSVQDEERLDDARPARNRSASVVVIALLAMVNAGVALAADEPTAAAATFEDAKKLMQQERGHDAVPILQRLAENGDVRARVLLGATYAEGKWLSRDPFQAYVLLRSAYEGGPGTSHGHGAFALARDLALRVGTGLSAVELIKADTLVAEKAQARRSAWDASFARGVRGELDVTNALDQAFPFSTGCAADPQGMKCGSLGKNATRPRCTGNVEAKPDVMPSAGGKGTYTPSPNFSGAIPRDARTGLQVHVDWSGYVCYVKVFDSSGDPEADRDATDAVSRWRLSPPTKAGVPVEARTSLYVRVSSS